MVGREKPSWSTSAADISSCLTRRCGMRMAVDPPRRLRSHRLRALIRGRRAKTALARLRLTTLSEAAVKTRLLRTTQETGPFWSRLTFPLIDSPLPGVSKLVAGTGYSGHTVAGGGRGRAIGGCR
ncbi:hypothetical protein VUR80DRAFT_1837 [Thermomyces stellatus]